MSVGETVDALASGAISATTLVDRILARIRRVDPALNAFLLVVDDAARESAHARRTSGSGAATQPARCREFRSR